MFPFVPQLASPLPLHNRFQGRRVEATIRPPGSRQLVIRNQEIIGIFELIHSITACLATFDYNNLEGMSTERVQLSDSIYLAEWRLFQLEEVSRNQKAAEGSNPLALGAQNDGNRETASSKTTDLSESLMFAGHLFMHLALRGQPPAAPRHRGPTEALMSSLCDILLAFDLLSNPEPYGSPRSYHSAGSLGNSSVESWPTTTTSNTSFHGSPLLAKPEDDFTQNALLWALFVGSCVRLPVIPTEFHFCHQSVLLDDYHQLFIQALKNCCLRRYIMDKETMATKLKDVLWLNSWSENQLDLIWAEIGDQLVP